MGRAVPLPTRWSAAGSDTRAPPPGPPGAGGAGIGSLLTAEDPSVAGRMDARAPLPLQGHATGDRLGERVGQGDVGGDGLPDPRVPPSGERGARAHAGPLAGSLASGLQPGTRSVEDADARITVALNGPMARGPRTAAGGRTSAAVTAARTWRSQPAGAAREG